ncbi:MAG: phosphatidate cytidylyltransferase [Planctomycetes bacterium]|nr:phosphatidate cytidylyltransferase [Planctomycetota bacterium]
MLKTRLWMGGILIALTVGMLVGDQHLAPWFPFLFLFQLSLTLAACFEFIHVLGPNRAPQKSVCYLGVVVFVFANWLINLPAFHANSWSILIGILAGFLLLAFLYEMAGYFGPGRSVERIALTWLIVGYLGFLPCFFAQIRWLTEDHSANSWRLALAVFVPKCCDTGAYFVGRLIGKHKMTPVLSPKKTWEGAVGGMISAVAAAIAIDRCGPATILRHDLLWEIGFGLTVGIAGMLGDLAESLIKRDCQTKDASTVMPGFGGVLDVVDAIIFAAPIAYLWFLLIPLAA